jgi:hypothetical protein
LTVRFPHLVFFEYVVGHAGIVTAALFLIVGLRALGFVGRMLHDRDDSGSYERPPTGLVAECVEEADANRGATDPASTLTSNASWGIVPKLRCPPIVGANPGRHLVAPSFAPTIGLPFNVPTEDGQPHKRAR